MERPRSINIESEATRAWIYRVLGAGIVLLTIYGLMSEAEAQGWMQLLVVLFGLGSSGLATKNTSREKHHSA